MRRRTVGPIATAGPIAQVGTSLGAYQANLRRVVRRQWRAEESRRRVADPVPIRVRWAAVLPTLGVQDHWTNITLGQGNPPLALHGGGIDDLADVLRHLPTRRVVILGDPGAGKTTTAIRLLLDLTDDGRPADPVPVLVSVNSWRPAEQGLRDWLAAHLATEYSALGAPAPGGGTVATALLDDGNLVPILDGLDELPLASRPHAIRAINAGLHAGDPLVLTCRTAEYVAAVHDSDAVTSALVIELQPLALSDIAEYLPRTAPPRPDSTTIWDALIGQLRHRPGDARTHTVLSVLRTPLMASLAREAYSDTATDPSHLMRDPRFATREGIIAHLLDRSVPAAYGRSGSGADRPWPAASAGRWLRQLATMLHRAGSYDLAWWRLVNDASAWVAAGAGVVTGVGAALVPVLLSIPDPRVGTGLVLLGAGAGAYFGLRHRAVPSTVHLSVSGGVARLRWAAVGLRYALRRAPAGWVLWTVALVTVAGLVGLHAGWRGALVGVGALCLVRGLDAWFDVPAEVSRVPTAEALLHRDRATGLWRGALRALILGGATILSAGASTGFGIGLAALIASVGFTAWGRFTLARSWYALRGQLPWRIWTFLGDAAQRGVLRRVGAVYQFRHAHLQDRLAGQVPAGTATDATDATDATEAPASQPEPMAAAAHRQAVSRASTRGSGAGRVVVVLTALELEYSAVRAHLLGLRPVTHPAGTLFEVGTLPGCPHPVALSALGEGNQTAAVVTERSAAMFRPSTVLFVGVAGALRRDIALGDIVVATRVYAYHSGAQEGDGFHARPRAWDAPHHLEQRARYLSRTGEWRRLLADPPAAARPGRPPTVHFGPIATGEVVVTAQDSALGEVIRQHYNDSVAVEMEGAGVARAAHLNRSLSALIIRGISDHADAEKSVTDQAGWQQLASANAAAFALSLVASLPVDS